MSVTVDYGDPHAPEIRALLQASHDLMQELFSPESNHFLSVDALTAPDIRFFAAHLDGKAVGCAALALRDGYGEVKSMFVDPETRRAGVAAGLMARLEAAARAEDLALLRLETGNLLDAARALYARFGFAVRGPFGAYEAHPHSVFMEKRLEG